MFLILSVSYAQQGNEQTIRNIKHQLDILATETVGLSENVKTEISVSQITLSNFLLALGSVHEVNINVAPELDQITLVNNFTNVTVKDLLVFLCKEYGLTIDFTENILSIKPLPNEIQEPIEHDISFAYNPSDNTMSLDAKQNNLYDVFKKIMDESGKNLVFSPGLEHRPITAYLKDTAFDAAMEQLAFANNLYLEQSKDGFYIFENNTTVNSNANSDPTASQRMNPQRRRNGNSNMVYEVIDLNEKTLKIDLKNANIEEVIYDIADALNVDIFIATPLYQAGTATFKAKTISFDALLTKLFEMQAVKDTSNAPQGNDSGTKRKNSNFNYKKQGDIYFFGLENQLSVREVEVIQLQHRSVELLTDPTGGNNTRDNRSNFSTNSYNDYNINRSNSTNNRNRESLNTNTSGNFNNYNNKGEALVSILPDELKQDLDITVDVELNSLFVNGTSASVKRFKKFIKKIDKPIPVVLIEVMIIEVSKSSDVETGVSWGIGSEPTTTQGSIYPETDITLGANTINKVIGGFDGFGSFNLGRVVPNFFANIKAMETNGNLKIRSTPKLSTLNGHRATFSNGQTSYYTVTQRNIYGTDNPQTSEITNYEPIDAELGLTIRPLVSGDGQVTLDISVIQSSFGSRIEENAPPDISSREFSSIIRMKDQDIAVLGGLEEQMKSNSGSGVPFLARIPIIKYLFSQRRREARKSKLVVLIKPTVIY